MKKFVLALVLTLTTAGLAFAQSTTSGDISGTLTDPTGAVIPGATVTVTSLTTGETKTTTSNGSGEYRISLLTPGTYKVVANASGFATVDTRVDIAAGTVTNDNLKLSVGQSGQTVEVTAEPVLVNTTNGDVETTFTSEEIQSLPNPGNDLTFVAQTAPGTVMNTGTAAGGYGNFSSFGISGLSNMFTLDGGYENDPFLNLNNTGASNLTLGNNEVDTVSVISPAYSSQFGGLGGAQVNEITASGGNRVHGNLNYYWDGRALNANDFFNKQTEAFYGLPNQATFVNANQYGAAIGGPIVRDRLFFFVNTEGIRATTPQNANINVPNALAQQCSLGAGDMMTAAQLGSTIPYAGEAINYIYTSAGAASPNLPRDVTESTAQQYLYGGNYTQCGTLNYNSDVNAAIQYHNMLDGTNLPTTNSALVGNIGEGGVPFFPAATNNQALMRTIFNTYNNNPLRATTPVQSPNDPAASTYYAKNSVLLTEYLITARLDWHISAKDNFYIHYKQDHGVQPTYTDLVSPLFSANSLQPAWEGQINETHTFSTRLVNQLVVTGNYYSAPFENTQNYSSIAPFTFIPITGTYATYGGENYDFPQGRNVSGYQIIDDVSYTKGANTLRVGYNLRRDNITDIQGVETVTPAAEGTEEGFIGGTVDYAFLEHYPTRPTQPVSLYNMGAYIEDSYKVSPTLTLTAGLRVERNSNPICHTSCFSVLNGNVFSGFPTNATVAGGTSSLPYNAAFPGGFVKGGRYRAFTGYQPEALMPRIGVNYQLSSKTVIRAGFGMFTDTFPGVAADDALSNVPTQFKATAYGYISGRSANAYDVNPSSATSGQNVTADSAMRFRQGYAAGTPYKTIAAQVLTDTGAPYAIPSFINSAPKVFYPTYEEFSLAIDQRLDAKTSIAALYVGNHGYHEPVQNGAFNLANAGTSAAFFPTIPHAAPVTPFGTITNIYSGASSNYNGVVITGTRRTRDLTFKLNYEFSKALDQISNGGLEPFAPDAGDSSAVFDPNPANLRANYGPADYNVKHNVTGSFVYQLPALFRTSNRALRAAVGGFEFSGDVFHNSGLPYSITQSISRGGAGIGSSFSTGTVFLVAKQNNSAFDHHCGGGAHVVLPNGALPAPCNFTTSFSNPTNFAQQGRNSLVGPSYTNVDFGAFKTFGVPVVPFLEGAKLKLGAQFFNLFNHTNFQNPNHARGADNSELGGIAATVGAPTSILGSTGGADASPRLIQLHAGLVF